VLDRIDVGIIVIVIFSLQVSFCIEMLLFVLCLLTFFMALLTKLFTCVLCFSV